LNDARGALGDLWRLAGGEPAALDRVELTGADPALPTGFKIGTAASAAIAAVALAATELWRLRTGRAQRVSVDLRAAVAAFRSEHYLRVDGEAPPDVRGDLFGFYRTGDGRWIQLHSAMPHHRERLLAFLGCAATREAVAAAVAGWKGQDLEDGLAEAGACAGLVRSHGEWLAHPQGIAVAARPPLEIVKLADSPPEPAGRGDRPLAGVRALDLTRVIAGPVCGRTLASFGADVLLVTAPHLHLAPVHVMDTGLGKLSTTLDLRRAADADRLRALVREGDVFCQSYRPGTLAGRGFGVEELARLRPGLVYVTLSAYGDSGPWRDRRGFETLIQSVSGMAQEEGTRAGLDRPQHLPAQVVDHGTGYLAALGALIALARRAREGGSYLVRVALARTGRWVDGLGRVEGRGTPVPTLDEVADLLAARETPFGRLTHVLPAARLGETPCSWPRPPVPLGTHEPAWPR
jgi:crotonobetainyl-CoA:carnitine CoA-transferase CaiB-like acyl-CoA transferase